MGIYLNPGNGKFRSARNSQIYEDKSGLIAYTNKVFDTEQRYLCVSRPRRFGKSMTANMLAAYYGRGCDSLELFADLEIAGEDSFSKYRNQCNVIFWNVQKFLSKIHDGKKLCERMEQLVLRELLKEYKEMDFMDEGDLAGVLEEIYAKTGVPFVFIIDEWDCLFRENKEDGEGQRRYLDFLRNLLKDTDCVKLAYMTGILPVKKYGTHSALNMFDEFSMTEPRQLAEYVGFTGTEVETLCRTYHMDLEETRRWYDGYRFKGAPHIYSPRSVVTAMLSGEFGSYWTKTESYEALKMYVEMNFDGLKETAVKLLAGDRQKIDTGTFTNDMTTFSCADDVLTLLVHLGYLGYDWDKQEVFIPNYEISGEFVNAVKGAGWSEVFAAVKRSEELLRATWERKEEQVAAGVGAAHMETSILNYHDENALAYTVSLAYYSARVYYTIVREMPAGEGFADLVFLPRSRHREKPAMIVELKWAQSAEGAIAQIKEKQYGKALEGYSGDILLVGVNYDKRSKKHECRIETYCMKP